MEAKSGDNGMEYCFLGAFVQEIFLDVESIHIFGSAMSSDIAYLKSVVARVIVIYYYYLLVLMYTRYPCGRIPCLWRHRM